MREYKYFILIFIALAIIGFGLDYLIINSNLPDLWKFVLLK